MKVGFDGTPLLEPRTGIGNYLHHLVGELAGRGPDLELVATTFTARGAGALNDLLPDGVARSGKQMPARLLRAAWLRTSWPPVEVLCGPVDVFHGTNFVAPPTRRAASVVTIHDLTYLRYPERVSQASLAYRDLVPAALRRGALVCAVTKAMGDEIRETYDLPAARVYVTPLGVDREWFSVDPSEPPAPGAPGVPGVPGEYVLAVGTLEPRKNLGTLLDAYRLAARCGTDLPPLVLVGAQGWGAGLDTYGIPDDRVVRMGRLRDEALRRVVAGARVLAFPSLYEGFGLPPLEALACGVPVLASDLPVTRETLGEEAVFADPTRAEALLSGLSAALTTPPGTPETRRARAAGFTWRRCATATVEAYRAAVG